MPYVVGENNRLCSNKGKRDLDEYNCKKAAEEMGLSFYVENEFDYPKGCYKINGVFFNKHSVGSRWQYAAPICSKQGED